MLLVYYTSTQGMRNVAPPVQFIAVVAQTHTYRPSHIIKHTHKLIFHFYVKASNDFCCSLKIIMKNHRKIQTLIEN